LNQLLPKARFGPKVCAVYPTAAAGTGTPVLVPPDEELLLLDEPLLEEPLLEELLLRDVPLLLDELLLDEPPLEELLLVDAPLLLEELLEEDPLLDVVTGAPLAAPGVQAGTPPTGAGAVPFQPPCVGLPYCETYHTNHWQLLVS